MTLDKIVLVLENCEEISIDAKYIASVETGIITPFLRMINSNCGFEEGYRTDYFYLNLINFENVIVDFGPFDNSNAIERLKRYPDITGVLFCYHDTIEISEQISQIVNYKKYLYVPWFESKKWTYINKWQRIETRSNKQGVVFCIEISDKTRL